MQVRSLGYRTSLLFAAFDGEVIDRGGYLVIRTPSNPTFFWGNYLLFDRPPGDGDFERWCELFANEIGTPPQVNHQTFGWDSPHDEHGVIEPFLQNGFHRELGDVLAVRQLHPPPRPASGLTVRPLCSDEEWNQSVENLVITREPGFSETGYRTFARGQQLRYRAMTAAGLGAWYGAFVGDRLVADLGIFGREKVGRYQYVQTHPEFQRRGIAGTLVHEAGRLAAEKFELETLVIVAGADSAAGRVYRSVGFEWVERQLGIGKW